MAKLVGYISSKTPGILTSVGSEGKVSRYVHRPKRKDVGSRSIWLKPCENHSQPQVVVPVELLQFMGAENPPKSLGIAKVCPLCWTILKHP